MSSADPAAQCNAVKHHQGKKNRDVSKCQSDIQSQDLISRPPLPTGRQVEDTFDSKSLNKQDSSVILSSKIESFSCHVTEAPG